RAAVEVHNAGAESRGSVDARALRARAASPSRCARWRPPASRDETTRCPAASCANAFGHSVCGPKTADAATAATTSVHGALAAFARDPTVATSDLRAAANAPARIAGE